MHPVFRSNRSLQSVIALWLVFAIVLSLLPTTLAGMRVDIGLLVFGPWFFLLLFFCLPNYYISEHLDLQKTSAIHLLSAQLGAMAVTIAFWFVLGYLWAKYAAFLFSTPLTSIYLHSLRINLPLGCGIYLLWIFIHYAYLLALQSEKNQSETLQKQLLLNQIELQIVKETVHPHFLYNSLNMLANLALAAPEKINPLCTRMADFLRYSVNYGNKQWVTLEEEIEHVRNYLMIEQERFGDRFELLLKVEDSLSQRQVIPLLLFPLVENCVKHGIDSSLERGYIHIEIKAEDGGLSFVIENSYDALGKKPRSTGIGQKALIKRLQAIYGGNYRFDVSATETSYRVSLWMSDRQALLEKPA